MGNPKILVTGATGATGSALVRQLSAAGISARGLTRNADRALDLPHIEFVTGDLNDPASLTAAFKGIEAVYLNVVPGSFALTQIDNAIAAAKAAGVAVIAKLSGLNVASDSTSAIVRMHAEGDSRVRRSGIPYSILEASSFFQNIEDQLEGISAHGRIHFPLGASKQSLIDVEDIAAVLVKVLTDPAWNNSDLKLTGPEALSFHDVAAALAMARGKPVAYVPISNEAFGQRLRDAGLPTMAVTDLCELFALFATGIFAQQTDGVRKVLGREPTSFSAYARRIFA